MALNLVELKVLKQVDIVVDMTVDMSVALMVVMKVDLMANEWGVWKVS